MRTRTWVAGVVAALPLLIGAAVPLLGGSASARPTPTFATPQPGQSDWPNQERLDRAAYAVVDLGAELPGVYAGVEMDVPTDVLIVHRVPGTADAAAFDQAVQDRIRGIARPSRVVLHDSAYTQAQLYAWQEVVGHDTDYWAGRGVRVTSIGSAPGDNCLRVGLANPDRDGDTVRSHYTFAVCPEQGPEMVLAIGS